MRDASERPLIGAGQAEGADLDISFVIGAGDIAHREVASVEFDISPGETRGFSPLYCVVSGEEAFLVSRFRRCCRPAPDGSDDGAQLGCGQSRRHPRVAYRVQPGRLAAHSIFVMPSAAAVAVPCRLPNSCSGFRLLVGHITKLSHLRCVTQVL